MGWIKWFGVRKGRVAPESPPSVARGLMPGSIAALVTLSLGCATSAYEMLAGTVMPSLGQFEFRATMIVIGSFGGGAVAYLFSAGYRRIFEVSTKALAEKAELADTIRLHDRAMSESNNGVVITDARKPDNPIVYVNPAFERLTGYLAEEVLGRNCRFLQGEDRDQQGLAELREALREGKAVTVVLRNFRKDGTEFWNEFSISPVHNGAGTITHFVGVQNDVTAAVANQGILASLNENLEAVVAERTAALAESHVQLRRQYDRLQALQMIDLAIRSSLDIDLTLNIIARQAQVLLEADAIGCLILTRAGNQLKYAAACGYRSIAVNHMRLPADACPASVILKERRTIHMDNVGPGCAAHRMPEAWEGEGFVSFVGIPLIAKGKTCGIMEILSRSEACWDHEWLQLADDLAGRATVALDSATLFADLQEANDELVRAYDATLEGWVRALDLRDHETEGHTQRVTQMTVQLAEHMGLPSSDLPHLRRGALLHDIGKIGIPDAVLLKPGPLDHDERITMEMHTVYAFRWLVPIPFLVRAAEIPYSHHEKWDGSGYPRQLAGEEIPLAARIFAVVDVWDALISTRPYREGWPEEKVLAYIESEAGTHFDPTVAAAFLELRRQELQEGDDLAA
jgi:PAS domain S-box-containing protein